MSDLITSIDGYRKGWKGGLPETICGSGSTLKSTKKQRGWIPKIIKQYGIKSIADIGAGDLNWIKHIDLTAVKYTAYDLIPRKPEVIRLDITRQVPPKSDMIMCLWVLNHFSMDDAENALSNIVKSCDYLLVTYRGKTDSDVLIDKFDCIESIPLNDKKDCLRLIYV